MLRTLDEKVSYNKARKNNPFSRGYVFGVSLYKSYGRADKVTRKLIKSIIDDNSEMAKGGDIDSKGFMCGIRDAANERKKKM